MGGGDAMAMYGTDGMKNLVELDNAGGLKYINAMDCCCMYYRPVSGTSDGYLVIHVGEFAFKYLELGYSLLVAWQGVITGGDGSQVYSVEVHNDVSQNIYVLLEGASGDNLVVPNGDIILRTSIAVFSISLTSIG